VHILTFKKYKIVM